MGYSGRAEKPCSPLYRASLPAAVCMPHTACVLAGSEQHGWVLSDLAAVDRRTTPWLVVGGHRPIYISSTNDLPGDGDQTVATDLRAAFEDAFVKYKVWLTLWGLERISL